MKNIKLVVLAGVLSILSLSASAMKFTVEGYGTNAYIYAYGDIVEGDERRLQSIIDRNPSVTSVGLYSDGGDVSEAQAMAYVILSSGLDTFVLREGYCASACTDMFLGGIERAIWGSETITLGYHASTVDTSDWTRDEAFNWGQYAGISDAYFMVLYVTPGYEWRAVGFLDMVHSRLDSDEMYWATTQELLDAGIVTRVIY